MALSSRFPLSVRTRASRPRRPGSWTFCALGRVFTRSELITLVMPDTVVLEPTIDVHIKALRRKLGRLGRQIETVRKAGYRFRAEPQRIEGSPD